MNRVLWLPDNIHTYACGTLMVVKLTDPKKSIFLHSPAYFRGPIYIYINIKFRPLQEWPDIFHTLKLTFAICPKFAIQNSLCPIVTPNFIIYYSQMSKIITRMSVHFTRMGTTQCSTGTGSRGWWLVESEDQPESIHNFRIVHHKCKIVNCLLSFARHQTCSLAFRLSSLLKSLPVSLSRTWKKRNM